MILEKIKDHFENKKYTKLTRKVGNNGTETSSGYIVDYSSDFIILQETDDFKLSRYLVFPVSLIKKLRFNKNDQYYHKIMIWEDEIKKVGINYKIDLTSWATIFNSIKKTGLNVIVECEGYDDNRFIIGPIVKTGIKNVHINYFDATGYFEDKPTIIAYENITKLNFDDRYINIFSKYLRFKKIKKVI